MRLPLLFSVILVAAACQTTEYAKGPISMSPGVKAGWERYKALQSPLYFVISTDGRTYGATFCPEGGASCAGEPTWPAIDGCQSRSGGVPCVIYGYRGKAVFPDNAPSYGSAPPKTSPSFGPTVTQVAPKPPPGQSAYDRLAVLKDLADRKLITPAEYETKRKEILGGL